MLLASAGVNYLMGIPLGDDVMLNYQTASFHDNAMVRELYGLRPTPEFEAWLERVGLWRGRGIRRCSTRPGARGRSGGCRSWTWRGEDMGCDRRNRCACGLGLTGSGRASGREMISTCVSS
jgi:hypothetical protein